MTAFNLRLWLPLRYGFAVRLLSRSSAHLVLSEYSPPFIRHWRRSALLKGRVFQTPPKKTNHPHQLLMWISLRGGSEQPRASSGERFPAEFLQVGLRCYAAFTHFVMVSRFASYSRSSAQLILSESSIRFFAHRARSLRIPIRFKPLPQRDK
jgi:hypothetical protein